MLRQALVIMTGFPAHDFAPKNHVKSLAAMRRSRAHVLFVLQGMLAAFNMVGSPLMHLLGAAAGILDVQVAELTLHGSLLFQNIWRPT
ncbi:hypothetical protein AB4Y85_11070 [Microvirga sp. 2YAF29]|uniref:hypothetical protein n=1 Tax=Microvirga sp. 2YAF29 TaxID=3233031 RepID=UPI003F987849